MNAFIDTYSIEELNNIVKNCHSMKEVIDKIGYTTHSGSNHNTVKKRLEKYGINTSHFESVIPTERNEKNIFLENSTANQSTLRRWYKRGEYSVYECSICGQEPFWQNKELTLILDHINGNNKDHRLENLRWVCPNCNQQLSTTNGRNIKKNRLKKINYCIDCGGKISKNSSRCKICNRIFYIGNNKKDIPVSREELKDLIREFPFVKIGEKFGVTDNAIRKWCDKFDLPRKKFQINKYTEEDWQFV